MKIRDLTLNPVMAIVKTNVTAFKSLCQLLMLLLLYIEKTLFQSQNNEKYTESSSSIIYLILTETFTLFPQPNSGLYFILTKRKKTIKLFIQGRKFHR